MAKETEVESFLGPDVRSPVGIPPDYQPTELSAHELFRVELGDFAGPLDLLLYLIRKHEIDIFDIPIRFITEKYSEMLNDLSTLPIDIASEFLVMAAELTHIKSKMLLPAKVGAVVIEDADKDADVDPRADLVRRLLEYQKYRDAAHQLEDRDQLGRDVFARVPTDSASEEDFNAGIKSVGVFRLVELMAGLLKREGAGRHEVHADPVRISDRIQSIIAFGEAREGRFPFIQLLDTLRSRTELVVTFIAILEMLRLRMLRIVDVPRLDDPERPTEAGTETETDTMAETDTEIDAGTETVVWLELTGKVREVSVVDDYR